jgi:hypothetical protein
MSPTTDDLLEVSNENCHPGFCMPVVNISRQQRGSKRCWYHVIHRRVLMGIMYLFPCMTAGTGSGTVQVNVAYLETPPSGQTMYAKDLTLALIGKQRKKM